MGPRTDIVASNELCSAKSQGDCWVYDNALTQLTRKIFPHGQDRFPYQRGFYGPCLPGRSPFPPQPLTGSAVALPQGKPIWTFRVRADMNWLLVTGSAIRKAISPHSVESVPPSPSTLPGGSLPRRNSSELFYVDLRNAQVVNSYSPGFYPFREMVSKCVCPALPSRTLNHPFFSGKVYHPSCKTLTHGVFSTLRAANEQFLRSDVT